MNDEKKDLKFAIAGLKIGMIGIVISIASTLLSLNYPEANIILKNIISLLLLIIGSISLWLAFKIKIPK